MLDPKIIDSTWTLFLDRDGVINRRLIGEYVKNWSEFEFLPGVLSSLALFAHRFGRLLVVTNQQGIYKGLMTESDLHAIHARMHAAIEAHGGRLDGIYHCAGSDADDPSQCRKPRIGMARQAKRDFPTIDFRRSLMVGDSVSDLQFGRNVGMYTVWISARPLSPEERHLADLHLKGLAQLSEWLR